MKRRTWSVCCMAAALTLGLTACGSGNTRRNDNTNDALTGTTNGTTNSTTNGTTGNDGTLTGDAYNYNTGNSMMDDLRDGLDNAGDAMRDGLDSAGDAVRNGVNSARTGLDNAGDRIRNAASGDWTATPTAVPTASR